MFLALFVDETMKIPSINKKLDSRNVQFTTNKIETKHNLLSWNTLLTDKSNLFISFKECSRCFKDAVDVLICGEIPGKVLIKLHEHQNIDHQKNRCK